MLWNIVEFYFRSAARVAVEIVILQVFCRSILLCDACFNYVNTIVAYFSCFFCAYKFYSSTAAIIVSAVGLLQFDYQFSSCHMDRVMRNRFLCRQKSTVIRIFRLEKLNLLISKRASLEVSKAVVQSKHLTIEFYTVVMLLTVILIIISVPYHPSLFHSRLETFLFCKSFPPLAFLFFFRTDSTGSPDCLPILLSIPVFTA